MLFAVIIIALVGISSSLCPRRVPSLSSTRQSLKKGYLPLHACAGVDPAETVGPIVEVIPPKVEGGKMKVVLALPSNVEDAKKMLISIPRATREAIDRISSTNEARNVKSRARSFLLKTKNLLMGNGFKETANKDFSKNALAGLGLNALLAYGFVSNVSYISCLILSWISFSSTTKLSPLAPGQWKPFLGIYAGYWAVNNILRPLRFSMSLVMTPFFNKFIDAIQEKTSWKRKYATASVVFGVNFCGTLTYMTLGVMFASMITGVPIK